VILLVHGPNLNLLGEREPERYGRETLPEIERLVTGACAAYGVEVAAFQSNAEGALLDFLQAHRHGAEGVIVNPGALAHTSRALPECLSALGCPVVEVHLDNPYAREPAPGPSLVAGVARGQIVGLGALGYHYAAVHLCDLLARAAAEAPGAAAAPSIAAQLARARPPAARPPPAVGSGAEIAPESEEEEIPEDLTARGDYEPL